MPGTLRINLDNGAITQYSNFAFTEYIHFNGYGVSLAADGLYHLGTQNKDTIAAGVTTDIDAWFEFPLSNFGSKYRKKVRRAYLYGEFTGSMKLTLTSKGKKSQSKSYNSTPDSTDSLESQCRFNTSMRATLAVYYEMKLENRFGADFSVDSVDLILNQTRR